MKIANLDFPDHLYYDINHQWVDSDGGQLTFGLTDYAQSTAGDVVFLDLPTKGIHVQAGESIGSIESGKWVGRLYAPVSGTISHVNEDLRGDPRLINREPYGRGWIARLVAESSVALDGLLHGEQFATFIRQEIERDQLVEVTEAGS